MVKSIIKIKVLGGAHSVQLSDYVHHQFEIIQCLYTLSENAYHEQPTISKLYKCTNYMYNFCVLG